MSLAKLGRSGGPRQFKGATEDETTGTCLSSIRPLDYAPFYMALTRGQFSGSLFLSYTKRRRQEIIVTAVGTPPPPDIVVMTLGGLGFKPDSSMLLPMAAPIPPPSSPPSSDSPSKTYWDRVVEVYKARLTVAAALVLVTVTITGYAIQSQRPELFLLAAAIPPMILAFDLIAKWVVLTPFLYKALISDLSSADSEPVTLLFLEFGRSNPFYRISCSYLIWLCGRLPLEGDIVSDIYLFGFFPSSPYPR